MNATQKQIKRFKLKLNSLGNIEQLLQELYDEVNKMVNEIQEQINKIANSTPLNDASIDSKTKYAKAMNDFLSSKEKALTKKLDIAKLMTEISKQNGNVKTAIQEADMDWSSFMNSVEALEKTKTSEGRKTQEEVSNNGEYTV